jgi:hypothetical protein
MKEISKRIIDAAKLKLGNEWQVILLLGRIGIKDNSLGEE